MIMMMMMILMMRMMIASEKYRRMTRQGEAKRTNDGPSCSMDDHTKKNICNFGNQGLWGLERPYGRRRGAIHVSVIVLNE